MDDKNFRFVGYLLKFHTKNCNGLISLGSCHIQRSSSNNFPLSFKRNKNDHCLIAKVSTTQRRTHESTYNSVLIDETVRDLLNCSKPHCKKEFMTGNCLFPKNETLNAHCFCNYCEKILVISHRCSCQGKEVCDKYCRRSKAEGES